MTSSRILLAVALKLVEQITGATRREFIEKMSLAGHGR